MLEAFKIGHWTDEEIGTGVTAIICERGATGGVSVMGGAPATRETDLLKNGKTVDTVNAVVLSGGSAFGLEASSGVMEYLFERGFGYNAGGYRVPIVVAASLYDLEYKKFGYPDKKAGYAAAAAAKTDNFVSGNIGAGTGATVGKTLGMAHSMKGGLGSRAFISEDGVEIAFVVAVNALGDIVDNGERIASVHIGKKLLSGKFLFDKFAPKKYKHSNTTIGCLITNAKLTKAQCNELAAAANQGYKKVISPCNTAFDGDAIFALASGELKADFDALKALAPDIVAQGVLAAIPKQ